MHPTLPSGTRPRPKLLLIVAALFVLFLASQSIASLILNYYWWGELGQVDTWARMWLYRWTPVLVQWLILFAVLWIAHARGLKYAGTGLREHRGYARLAALAAMGLALFLLASAVDGWTVARYFGGSGVDRKSTRLNSSHT